MPSCFRLLRHCVRRAASRAAWTAGSNRAIRIAMIAITTNSSISVKPARRGFLEGPKRIEISSQKRRIEGNRTESPKSVKDLSSVLQFEKGFLVFRVDSPDERPTYS